MKNEIVRKLTSLTLMTFMFAGGLVFAAPGVMQMQVQLTTQTFSYPQKTHFHQTHLQAQW